MYLPDVNVWLAMTFRAHVHHIAAKAWFDGLGTEVCYFCRLTQQGFLRLATNRKAFPADAVQMDEAWRLYDTLLGDPRVAFALSRLASSQTGGHSQRRGSSRRKFGTMPTSLPSRSLRIGSWLPSTKG